MKKTSTSSPISRRTMLRSSGALAATSAVLAACSSTKPSVARIGESPTTVKLEDLAVTDVVLLRTAMSMETMASAMLSDSAVTALASKDTASVIAAFAADHTSHLEDLQVLISARNGEAYSETNAKLMQAYGQTALDLVASGKLPEDTLALTLAVETLIAATYQYFCLPYVQTSFNLVRGHRVALQLLHNSSMAVQAALHLRTTKTASL
jgi:hypothetical protein